MASQSLCALVSRTSSQTAGGIIKPRANGSVGGSAMVLGFVVVVDPREENMFGEEELLFESMTSVHDKAQAGTLENAVPFRGMMAHNSKIHAVKLSTFCFDFCQLCCSGGFCVATCESNWFR